MPPPRIGELLVSEGLLSSSAIQRALGFQKTAAPRVKLGSILLTWDLIDEPTLLKTLAALHHCDPVSGDTLAEAPVDVVRLLPAAHAIRLNAIPYALEKSRIRVAFVNPSDLGVIDEAAALTGHACVPGVATELRLLQAHRRFYGRALPLELRPAIPRPSRPVPPAPDAAPLVRAVPVTAARAERDPSEASSISVPELPIPPSPAAPRDEAPSPDPAKAAAPEPSPADAGTARAHPQPEAMWMTVPREPPPQSAAVLGMWSHAAAPPPITDEEIGDLALAGVPAEFPRVILFARRHEALAGWRARGVDAADVARLELPDAFPSVLSAVRDSGAPHFGRVDPERWPEGLRRLLDGPPPCAVFPVHSADGVAAILYADRRGAPMKFEDTGLLARAAADIAALLVRESDSRYRAAP